MKLISPVFINNSKIPQKYSCEGEGLVVPLTVSDVPANAKSLVLEMDDPDAPVGTFIHWLVFNIDPTIKTIKNEIISEGQVVGQNSLGKPEYVPPCPPSGVHHYRFVLSALDTMLDLKENVDRKKLINAVGSHIIERAELVGLYSPIK